MMKIETKKEKEARLTIEHSHPLHAEACKMLDGSWTITGVTYKALPCGCRHTGGGVLPAPLTVKLCPLHEAAADLLKAARAADALFEGLNDNGALRTSGKAEWAKVKAAILKATEKQ